MTIQFRRGLAANLPDPTDALVGEPLFTTDDGKVRIKKADGNFAVIGQGGSLDLSGIPAGSVVKVNPTQDGLLAATAADIGLGNVDNTSDLAKPVSTATLAALALKADASSVPSALSDLIGTPSDQTQTATIVWDVATSSWVISQGGGGGQTTEGYEFRGLFSASIDPFGPPGSPYTATDIVVDLDNIFDPPVGDRYASQITASWENDTGSSQYPFFAVRFTGSNDPGWTPQFYHAFQPTTPLSGIVNLGSHSLTLGADTHTYTVYRVADLPQDNNSTISLLID